MAWPLRIVTRLRAFLYNLVISRGSKNNQNMEGSVVNLEIQSWSSWEAAEPGFLCSTYSRGELTRERLEKPDLGSIPAMQRRRLSPLARAVFHVLERCGCQAAETPVIFSSEMGEIERTQDILEAIANSKPVSPAAFSLSVHNAIAGLWSLVHGVRLPLLALAPPARSPVPALLEAAGQLHEGLAATVQVVYYEGRYPDFYAPFLNGPGGPVAIGLRLALPSGSGHPQLQLAPAPGESERPDPTENFSCLANLLHRRAGPEPGHIVEPQCSWQIGIRP